MGNNAESREPIINTDQINHVEVDISKLEAAKKLVASIESKIKPMPSPKCCIHRVPQEIRFGKEDKLYIPQTVSIGPFHHGKPGLQGMEEHKKWYLQALLYRSKTKLEDLVNAILDMELDARECYGELLDYDLFSKDHFVEMMLLDGCFILELFIRFWDKFNKGLTNENDRIFIANWTIPSCRQDMMLLENQIPFAVLEALYDVINKDPQYKCECSLIDLVAFFFDPIFPTEETLETDSTAEGAHLLDFLRNLLFPSAPTVMKSEDRVALQFTKCATSLSEAGVKLKKKVQSQGLLDITFNIDNGMFEIPPFLFGRSMAALLFNLIALEQCQGYDERVISYVLLLDSLINSVNDVKLLREKEIIQCFFYEDEKVSSLINNVGKGVFVNEFYYEGLCNQVNAYCKSDWHRWRATLKHDYFKNPWAIISFIAAIVLLLLTLAQTVISFLAYPAFH